MGGLLLVFLFYPHVLLCHGINILSVIVLAEKIKHEVVTRSCQLQTLSREPGPLALCNPKNTF